MNKMAHYAAIILAAGVGSRLKSSIPKCLIRFQDKLIIERQIDNLLSIGIEDITVIVGHKNGYIMEVLSELYPDVAIKYVYNARFNSTNTAKSLMMGLQSMKYSNKSVIWMNADVITEVNEFTNLIQVHERSSFKNLLLVNTESVSDEEIKYITQDGIIVELSKEVNITKAEGESIGINIINSESIEPLIQNLNEVADSSYFEEGLINMGNSNNTHFKLSPLKTSGNCIEIDFQSDYDRAVRSFD